MVKYTQEEMDAYVDKKTYALKDALDKLEAGELVLVDATDWEDKYNTLVKTHDTCLADRDSFAADLKECQKILTKEQEDRSEIEDKLADVPKLVTDEQYKVLEDKLSLCDGYYKMAATKLLAIGEILATSDKE